MDKKSSTGPSLKCLNDTIDLLQVVQAPMTYDVYKALIDKVTLNNVIRLIEMSNSLFTMMDFLLVRQSLQNDNINTKSYKDFRF